MPPSTRRSAFGASFRAVLPPLLVLAGAIGYIGIDLWGEELPSPVPGVVPPLVHAGLVALQAVALLLGARNRLLAFGAVVSLDLVILATTAGELGVGSLGVLFASYAVARHESRRVTWTALGVGAAATTLVGVIAMVTGSGEALVLLLLTVVTRIALLYVAPAAVAEYVRGREALADSLREQARMAEREQRERAQSALTAERTALARELHDIAGHHLSGIIVSAQAASALTRTDPDRAREMLRALQDDARTTLADLRRTVGLLRSDGEADTAPGGPSPAPTITGIDMLVDEARARGQDVEYSILGVPRTLGPLAETAAYRMVQESLANAARHAPGAVCRVEVHFARDAVELTVVNDPAPHRPESASRIAGGYGLSGMAERAELIGATLSAGPADDGGWRNRLTIPADGRSDR